MVGLNLHSEPQMGQKTHCVFCCSFPFVLVSLIPLLVGKKCKLSYDIICLLPVCSSPFEVNGQFREQMAGLSVPASARPSFLSEAVLSEGCGEGL